MASFVGEFKRRKVLQVVAVYAVATVDAYAQLGSPG